MTRDGMKEGRRGKQPEAILAEGTGKTGQGNEECSSGLTHPNFLKNHNSDPSK